jgi:hypothetical protein
LALGHKGLNACGQIAFVVQLADNRWGVYRATPICHEDPNKDGEVNVDDLLIVLAFWGDTPPAYGAADVNSDGTVNVDDLLAVINAWGPCTWPACP